jgi:uncharacterized protein (TIGR03067 family)
MFVAMALVVAAPGLKDPPKKDSNPLVGEWIGEKIEAAGMAVDISTFGRSMEFKADGNLVTRNNMAAPEEAKYTVDAKKDPPEIDITEAAKIGKVERMFGIYKIEGDTLTLCLVVDAKRPVKFAATADVPNQILMTFKRAQK